MTEPTAQPPENSSASAAAALAAEAAAAARDWLSRHNSDLLDDLALLTQAETPSDDLAQLAVGTDVVSAWLSDRLGTAPGRQNGGGYGDILTVDLPGTQPSVAPPVLLLAHYDTVWPTGTLAGWPFTVTDDEATGPGVFDMKSGLVQGVWAVRALDAVGLARPPVRVLCNGDEEIGSPASRSVIEDAARDAEVTLVLEPSADGRLKTARKGIAMATIEAHGVEAHAGLDSDKGASAVHALAVAVRELAALSDPAAGTTVNVGVLTGGTRSNVVAGRARCEVDIRVSTAAEADRVLAGLQDVRSADPRVSLRVDAELNRPPMERTADTEALVGLARAAGLAIGTELGETAVGGASDGNFVAALGRPVLDGLGAVGSGAHARHEHIQVPCMVERAAVVAGLVAAHSTASAP